MTSVGTITIGCSSIGADDIVISTDGFSTYYVDKAGLGRVARIPRETFATASPFMDGQARTQVVWDESSYPLVMRVQADSTAALDSAIGALENALSQFIYPVTDLLDGVTKVWTAFPATWNSTDGLRAFERVMAYHEDLAITIPVDPIPT